MPDRAQMTVIPRRKITDLVDLYTRHRRNLDVYVEGVTDKNAIQFILSYLGINDVAVYEVDSVDIPADKLQKHNQKKGRKGLVTTLALELHELSPDAPALCVADRDYDTLLGTLCRCPMLQHTDYSCQEAYLLDVETISKWSTFVLGRSLKSPEAFLRSLTETLTRLHLMRATNLHLNFGLPWVDPRRCYSHDKESIIVDERRFLEKYLNPLNRSQRDEFLRSMQSIEGRIGVDPRMHVTKDDLTSALRYAMTNLSNRQLPHTAESVLTTFWPCIDIARVSQCSLFCEIVRRAGHYACLARSEATGH